MFRHVPLIGREGPRENEATRLADQIECAGIVIAPVFPLGAGVRRRRLSHSGCVLE